MADEELRFRPAAEQLHGRQPAVRQQLRKAEAELGGLAEEQATLRRLATLAARGAPPAEVFEAVISEIGRLFVADAAALGRYETDGTFTVIGFWGRADGYVPSGARHPTEGRNLAKLVLEARGPARIDSYAEAAGSLATAARDRGWRSSVGAPVIVAGRTWGMVAVASTTERPLLLHGEARLANFTELLAAAIANAQSREDLARLAEEQAALRRVATLVARGAPPARLFAVVAEQVSRALHVPLVNIARYEDDGMATECASFSRRGEVFAVGTRWSLDGTNVIARVRESGRPARINDYAGLDGTIAETLRCVGIRSRVGVPIIVAGHLWGAMLASSEELEPLPSDTEARLAKFTELVATAIANSETQAEVGRLAEEHAALRRVATLVARGLPPTQVFGEATEAVGRLIGADAAGMIRYHGEELAGAVATWTAMDVHAPVATDWTLEGDSLASRILETGQAARIDDWGEVPGPIAEFVRTELGFRSSVGTPIAFGGRVWGALTVHSTRPERLPADTESRVAAVAELVATAISNAEARAEVARLADEQAALRRVATLVAHQPSPDEVFAAVAEETGRLLPVEDTAMLRYEDEGTATVVATWGQRGDALKVGTRMPLGGENVTTKVHRTGRPARTDDYVTATGAVGSHLRKLVTRSAVGCPIEVDGSLWGVLVVAQGAAEPLPAGVEARLEKFAELVATAISNVQARSDLATSRARIVAAADEERRRVVRDLHDGAQQRLVHTVVTLKLASRALERDEEDVRAFVTEALAQAKRATAELRELSHGILPAVLTRGGLRAGVEALAARMPVPVEIGAAVGRLPAAVEATAYFVVAEALTNVAKHARAQRAEVNAWVEGGLLHIHVRDDGVGGAQPHGGGLLGLDDRLAVLSGQLRIDSPVGGGTLVAAAIPLAAD